MSEEPSRKSHVVVWALCVFLVIPLLYFLSVPWLHAYALTHDFYGSPLYNAYVFPFKWTWGHTFLRAALDQYEGWCFRVLHRG